MGADGADFRPRVSQANRGTNLYRPEVAGRRVGASAKDLDDLRNKLKVRFASHPKLSEADAKAYLTAAFAEFAKNSGEKDPDFAWMWANHVLNQHKSDLKKPDQFFVPEEQSDLRKGAVEWIEKASEEKAQEKEKKRRAALKKDLWRQRVQRLADEAGVSYEYTEEFLKEYEILKNPALRHPGVIDPRGIPFIQLGVYRTGAAELIRHSIPVVGSGLIIYEAYTGRGVLSNRNLSTFERVFGVAVVIAPSLIRPSARGARGVARTAGRAARASARTAFRVIQKGAKASAAIAIRLNKGPRTMLRLVGRLKSLSASTFKRIREKIARAKAKRKKVELTPEEAEFMATFEEAFKEFESGTKLDDVVFKARTIKGYIFNSVQQALTLGRILGRNFGKSTLRNSTKAALRKAEKTAADLVARVRKHWDEALPKGGKSADDAAKDVFDKLKAANPANPNDFVRRKLYNLWRQRALRRIYKDKKLRDELRELAGIVVGYNKKAKNYTIHVRAKSAGGKRTQVPLDFDHDVIGHSEAVTRALRSNDHRMLRSTVDAGNLQFLTGRENRNVVEALREYARAAEAAAR